MSFAGAQYCKLGDSVDRTIVGYGFNPNGQNEALIATVHEPSTLAPAACGALGMLLLAGRRCRR